MPELIQLLFEFAKVQEEDRVYLTWVCEFWEDMFPLPEKLYWYPDPDTRPVLEDHWLDQQYRRRSKRIDDFINKYFKKNSDDKMRASI